MSEESKINMLLTWHDRATRANLAHYLQAEKCQYSNNALTIFNLLAAILVLFLANSPLFVSNGGPISALYLSFSSLAVVLSTALQYVLKLDERSFDHKSAGNEFTTIKRKIERILIAPQISDTDIKEVESDHNHTAKNHNLVRQRIWVEIRPRYEEACSENKKFLESLVPIKDS